MMEVWGQAEMKPQSGLTNTSEISVGYQEILNNVEQNFFYPLK